jgi:hypothetical protein
MVEIKKSSVLAGTKNRAEYIFVLFKITKFSVTDQAFFSGGWYE